jgi:hypothetical protein
LGYAPEAVITAVLVIAGLTINGSSHLQDHSKLALEVLLGVFEIVFLFSRRIERRLKALADDSLTVIPRDRLGRVLYQHLDDQRTKLLTRAEQLADQSDCELEKHEMYAELIGLTNAVTLVKSGHTDGTIVAISSTNVEDFEEEPLAGAYLHANRVAVERHIHVRRLFLLDAQQAKASEVVSLLTKHDAALKLQQARGGRQSGTRWLLKSQIPFEDRAEDFALFADGPLVIQAPGGVRFELTQDDKKISRALDTFDRLWNHPDVRQVVDLYGPK